jgi:transposase
VLSKGVKLTLINPMQRVAFAKMRHKTTKNDCSDARLLAQNGENNKDDLVLYKMPDA